MGDVQARHWSGREVLRVLLAAHQIARLRQES
jgi:hypothetical protein